MNPKIIVAEDEQHLRRHLIQRLTALWPEADIVAEAANGNDALDSIRRLHPNIAFLDIRMPGLSGLEVARKAAKQCRIVFITAYDQYAIKAFEQAAADYILKPVSDERLKKTITRLQEDLSSPSISKDVIDALNRIIAAPEDKSERQFLQWLRAQHGDSVKLIPVVDVYYFQAGDKYTAVVTQEGEWLIRKTIRSLSEELDPDKFWQIHRGTIVNMEKVTHAKRTVTGKYQISLRGSDKTLTASRTYAHLFKQM